MWVELGVSHFITFCKPEMGTDFKRKLLFNNQVTALLFVVRVETDLSYVSDKPV